MKTLFDLRENQNSKIYESIQDLYEEPVKIIKFKDKSITACIGCWTCWLTTPGRCVMNDQMSDVYSDYMNSDTVILLLETNQGFINHKAKAFFDRTIPHYHPYIEIVSGECHHVSRYEHYPNIVFYYQTEGLTNNEAIVIEDYLYRTAYHFKSKAFRIIKNESLQLHSLESRKAKNQVLPLASTNPIDKLIIYNGSPRKSGSNSTLILAQVAKNLGDKLEIRDLKEKNKWDKWSKDFIKEENVMFFVPLYVHAMPSHVMKFIEKLEVSKGSISFFIQSGFPESSQSHYVEAYFQLLSLRLGRTYLGTCIKAGVEGLQMRPVKAQVKMIEPLIKAIANLVNDGKFNSKDIYLLSKPVRLRKVKTVIFNLLVKKLLNLYWDQKLKSNSAYDKSFDRPYLL